MVSHRQWLIQQYGSICADCGVEIAEDRTTLDHDYPRKGQTAYDRRDNLVLACKACNAAKRDLAPLAFLLSLRSRAANLLRYGAHLSAGLIELAKSLLPEGYVHPEPEPVAHVRPRGERKKGLKMSRPIAGSSSAVGTRIPRSRTRGRP